MRDGALPAIALCLVFGMMLTYAPGKATLWGIAAGTLVAIVVSAVALPLEWRAQIVLACWAGTILAAAGVYLARPIPAWLAVFAAVAAGLLTGLLTGEVGRPGVLAAALPCMLIRFPAIWLVRSRRAIVLKVLTSWIVAVAILSAGLTVATGANAGSDHLE